LVVANASFNLTLSKHAAFTEAWRILRPGGRMFACELVKTGSLPDELLADPMGHATSLGGAIGETDLRTVMTDAGFEAITVTDHRRFEPVTAVILSARKPKHSAP
ncbi:unnamed protein product, partial [marine sediment metagenome]